MNHQLGKKCTAQPHVDDGRFLGLMTASVFRSHRSASALVAGGDAVAGGGWSCGYNYRVEVSVASLGRPGSSRPAIGGWRRRCGWRVGGVMGLMIASVFRSLGSASALVAGGRWGGLNYRVCVSVTSLGGGACGWWRRCGWRGGCSCRLNNCVSVSVASLSRPGSSRPATTASAGGWRLRYRWRDGGVVDLIAV